MSLEISRRSFLKYSALTAVAVAGSSMLTGCGSDNSYERDGIGDITVLQIKTDVQQGTYSTSNLTIPMTINVKRNYEVLLNPANFSISIEDTSGNSLYSCGYYNNPIKLYKSGSTDPVTDGEKVVKKDGDVDFTLVLPQTIDWTNAKTVVLRYIPDFDYIKYTCIWNLTVGTDIKPES